MEYNGQEIHEFRCNKNIGFTPPKRMLVPGECGRPQEANVVAYLGGTNCACKVIAVSDLTTRYYTTLNWCAELPKPKTNWDLYCERYGTNKNMGVSGLFPESISCWCCPAKLFCGSRFSGCRDTFRHWAESKAEVRNENR